MLTCLRRTSAVFSLAFAQMTVAQAAADMGGAWMRDDAMPELGLRRAATRPVRPTSGYAIRAKAKLLATVWLCR
jgi:hypothetical protein